MYFHQSIFVAYFCSVDVSAADSMEFFSYEKGLLSFGCPPSPSLKSQSGVCRLVLSE